jgi:multisubunit Na+/H+ antiporter MnhB subunit
MRVRRTGPPTTLDAVRKGILAVIALGILGMSAELLMIGHYEDSSQLLPLAAAAIALALILAVAWRPRVFTLRTLQFVMLTFVGTGITGITLHFEASAEFQREIDPAISGMALVRKVMDATAPPLLAPGIMVQLGLLGLLYTYRHPVLGDETLDLFAEGE